MASHSQAHLQIFTPDQASNKNSKFHLFPQLTKELRQKIWIHALECRPRIIHLALYDPIHPTEAHNNAEGTTEFPENGESFWAITNGYQTMSKLFRINRDSREAALLFYRVHFPCKLRTIGEVVKWGIIYFSPEHDFLRITPKWSVKHTLFNFIYHLKTTYDPRGIGLLNLVISGNDMTGNDLYITDPSDPELEGGPIMAFTQIIKNLRKVIFYTTMSVGRQILGPPDISILTSEPVYNRSFPIEARVPTFDRLPHDPRNIGEDLKQVFLGYRDNRDVICTWYQLLKKWNISGTKIEYKWHLAFEPQKMEQVFGRISANKFIQREENTWNGYRDPTHIFAGIFEAAGLKEPIGAETEKYKNEDLETAVKTAFGFWLFPINALGLVQEDGVLEEEDNVARPVLSDFSENWPELWVASLPERD